MYVLGAVVYWRERNLAFTAATSFEVTIGLGFLGFTVCFSVSAVRLLLFVFVLSLWCFGWIDLFSLCIWVSFFVDPGFLL